MERCTTRVTCSLCSAHVSAGGESFDDTNPRAEAAALAAGFVAIPKVREEKRVRSEGHLCADCVREVVALAPRDELAEHPAASAGREALIAAIKAFVFDVFPEFDQPNDEMERHFLLLRKDLDAGHVREAQMRFRLVCKEFGDRMRALRCAAEGVFGRDFWGSR